MLFRSGAPVRCSSNPDELLEALEFAMKHDNIGISINGNSAVFFKDNANFRGSYDFFFIFKKGMTAKDIIAIAANPPSPGTFVV